LVVLTDLWMIAAWWGRKKNKPMTTQRHTIKRLLQQCQGNPAHKGIVKLADSVEKLAEYSELLSEGERQQVVETIDGIVAEVHKALVRIRAVRETVRGTGDSAGVTDSR